jgi:hypothetical protein
MLAFCMKNFQESWSTIISTAEVDVHISHEDYNAMPTGTPEQ